MSLLLPYTLMFLVLDFSQMVLAVRKHLKIAKIIIPNNSCYCNFLKKSIPGDARAQVLQEPVGASHADQGRKSGGPSILAWSWGQELSNEPQYVGLGAPAPEILP